ncbi:MAG: IS3 family transposase [Gemmatimonadota bacterium]
MPGSLGRRTPSHRSVRVHEGRAPTRRVGRAEYPIAVMARVLEVSTSGFYAWRKRGPSKRAREDAWLLERIETLHEESRGTHGAPRIHAELLEQGIQVSRKRVARLMREAGLVGVSRRRGTRTTIRGGETRPAPDLVDRDFAVSGPNELWVADITYVPTWQGFLYLTVVVDAWSRRVVGWAMYEMFLTD